MPIDYKKYDPDWKSIRGRILDRACNRCEQCGLHNYAVGYRDKKGRFIPNSGTFSCDASGRGKRSNGKPLSYSEAKAFADQYNESNEYKNKYIVIVLTIAHLDHDIKNNADNNLKALCQRCHLRYDRDQHKRSRRRNSKMSN